MRKKLFTFLTLSLCTHICADDSLESIDFQTPSYHSCYAENLNDNTFENCYEYCYDDSCNCQRYWFKADFLLWRVSKATVDVPLVIAAPVGSTTTPILGEPGTSVIMGNNGSRTIRSGARFKLGTWLDDECGWGTEMQYFFVGDNRRRKNTASTGQTGSRLLAIPYINAITGEEAATRLSSPGAFSGAAQEDIVSDMEGFEWNVFCPTQCFDDWAIRYFGGFRYLNLIDKVSFRTDSPNVLPPIDVFSTKDKFFTRNRFFGGQIGIDFDYSLCNGFFFKASGKIAFGCMYEKLRIKGELITNDFNGFNTPLSYPAGYFALPTNIGRFKQQRFAVIPEIEMNIGYLASRHFSILLGYNILYINNVIRAGRAIDRVINPTQGPAYTNTPSTLVLGPRRPKPLLDQTGLWAQGVNIGVEYRF